MATSVAEAGAAPPAAPRRARRPAAPWPGWAGAALVASGATLIVLETTSVLAVAGALLLAVGLFGLLYRRARPVAGPT